MNFDDIFIFFQRNPWILRIGNKFFDNFDKILPFLSKAWNFETFLTIFGCFFVKSRKKAGETLRKQQFQVKSFGFVHTRTRRVSVCMLAHACTCMLVHMYIVLCARECRVCESLAEGGFLGNLRNLPFWRRFFKISRKTSIFIFWAGRRPSPKG